MSLTFLLADDDPSARRANRELTRAVKGPAGEVIEAIEANSIREALELLRSQRVDVLVTDVDFGADHSEGLRAIGDFWNAGFEGPILVSSGHLDAPDNQRLLLELHDKVAVGRLWHNISRVPKGVPFDEAVRSYQAAADRAVEGRRFKLSYNSALHRVERLVDSGAFAQAKDAFDGLVREFGKDPLTQQHLESRIALLAVHDDPLARAERHLAQGQLGDAALNLGAAIELFVRRFATAHLHDETPDSLADQLRLLRDRGHLSRGQLRDLHSLREFRNDAFHPNDAKPTPDRAALKKYAKVLHHLRAKFAP